MNVLVIGCGRLGRSLSEMLDQHDHDVAIIDYNPDSFLFLNESFDGMTVTGFPLDMKVLRTAGIESCDAVAVVTPDDNLNITVSQIAREFFGVQNVVARISDPTREKIFENLGLKTVCHTKLACDAIFTALTQPWDSRNISFGTSTVTFHVRTPERSQIGINATMMEADDGEVLFGVAHMDGSMELRQDGRRILLEEGDRAIFAKIVD